MPSAVKGVLGGTGAVKGAPGVPCAVKSVHGSSCAVKGVYDDEDAISEIESAFYFSLYESFSVHVAREGILSSSANVT